jgi:hypothetical protein
MLALFGFIMLLKYAFGALENVLESPARLFCLPSLEQMTQQSADHANNNCHRLQF